jgi:hypothetical protein
MATLSLLPVTWIKFKLPQASGDQVGLDAADQQLAVRK